MVYLFYDGPSIRISEVRISEVYQIDFTNGIGDDFVLALIDYIKENLINHCIGNNKNKVFDEIAKGQEKQREE